MASEKGRKGGGGSPSMVQTNAFPSQQTTTQLVGAPSMYLPEPGKLERSQSQSGCSSTNTNPKKKLRRLVKHELRAVRDIDVPLNFTRVGTAGLQEWRRVRGERRHITDEGANILIQRHKLNLVPEGSDWHSEEAPAFLVQVTNKGEATHVWDYTLQNRKSKQTFWRVATLTEIRANVNSKRQGTTKIKKSIQIERRPSDFSQLAALEDASRELSRSGVASFTQTNVSAQGDAQLLQKFLEDFHISEGKMSPKGKEIAVEFIKKFTKVVQETPVQTQPSASADNAAFSVAVCQSRAPLADPSPTDPSDIVQSEDPWLSIFEDKAVIQELVGDMDPTDDDSPIPVCLDECADFSMEGEQKVNPALSYTRHSDSGSGDESILPLTERRKLSAARLKRRRYCSPCRDLTMTEVQMTIKNLQKRRFRKNLSVQNLSNVLKWTESDPDKVTEFIAENGMQAIAKAMSRNRIYLEVQELGCRALSKLVNNNVQITQLEEPVAVVCETMGRYREKRQIQLAGCEALQGILASTTTTIVEGGVNATLYLQGALPRILDALKTFPADSALQEYGCRALYFSVQGSTMQCYLSNPMRKTILQRIRRAQEKHPGNDMIASCYVGVSESFS